jgi:3-phosphoglycerate kinase
MFKKKTVKDINLRGKTVLLRVDYNVPIKNGIIQDDFRIRQSLETIKYLISQECKIIICSHLGRPEGMDPSLSLRPVVLRLSKLLNKGVAFAPNLSSENINSEVKNLKSGQILLLENLRFNPGEDKDDDKFAKQLSELADIFVQDAFGVVHRYNASTVAVTKYLPSVAGLLLECEVDTITNVAQNPKKPLMVVVGGAKIADKIDILERFISMADYIMLGGAMANTFLKASGTEIGASKYDENELPLARRILQLAKTESKKRNFTLQLPFDVVVSKKMDSNTTLRIVDWSSYSLSEIESYPKRPPKRGSTVLSDEKIFDIGPFTGAYIAGVMQSMNTVIWNGTMGVTEVPSLITSTGPYSHGSELVLQAISGEFGHKPFSLVGGGDTAGFVQSKEMSANINHLSTGGGASLELLGGHKLPGVEALLDK